MSFSEILNILLGGSLVTLVLTLATMKSTVRKANAEAEKARADAEAAKADAEKARADAEAVRITNVESATRILMENIVKPLKEELHATREELHATKEELHATKKEMASTKREMARLRKAVEAAVSCPHSDGCPVVAKLRDNQKDSDGADTGGGYGRGTRYCGNGNKADPQGDCAGKPGGPVDIRGQPP